LKKIQNNLEVKSEFLKNVQVKWQSFIRRCFFITFLLLFRSFTSQHLLYKLFNSKGVHAVNYLVPCLYQCFVKVSVVLSTESACVAKKKTRLKRSRDNGRRRRQGRGVGKSSSFPSTRPKRFENNPHLMKRIAS